MKNRLKPYELWDIKDFKKVILSNLYKIYENKPRDKFKTLWYNLIIEALDSKQWDVLKQYNGCTIVQDWIHPCPACFCHDYMWITGRGGIMSDGIFKALMKAEGMPKGKINRRWLGVRLGWLFGYYWKYKIKGTLKKPSKSMIELNNYLKK